MSEDGLTDKEFAEAVQAQCSPSASRIEALELQLARCQKKLAQVEEAYSAFERAAEFDATHFANLLAAANERIQNLEASKIHSCHSGCQRPECVLRRRVKELEKDKARLRFTLRELVEQCKTGDDITAWWRTAAQRAEEALAEDDQPSQQKGDAQ